jgi:hypothetical protein
VQSKDETCGSEQYGYPEPPGPPKRRPDPDTDGFALGTPNPVIVGSLYLEYIFAGAEVGVIGKPSGPCINPILVKSLHFIPVTVLLGNTIMKRGKLKGKVGVTVRKNKLRCLVDGTL